MAGLSHAKPMADSQPILDHRAGPVAVPRSGAWPAAQLTAARARRLVVLIPDADVDQASLAHALWSLAYEPGLRLLLLSVVNAAYLEPRARARLATLATLIREARTPVEVQVGVGTRWEPLFAAHRQAGDLLVCHAEQKLFSLGLRHRPLARVLAARLNVPVFVLRGHYPDLPAQAPQLARQIFSVLPSVVIIAAFFGLQVSVQRLASDWQQTALLIVTVLAEFGLLWAWEKFIIEWLG